MFGTNIATLCGKAERIYAPKDPKAWRRGSARQADCLWPSGCGPFSNFLSIGFPLLCQTLFGQPMWKRRVFLVSSTLSAYAASLAMRGGPDSLEQIYGNCIVVVIFPPCCHFKKSTFNCEFLCMQSRVIVWLAGSFHHKFFPQLGQWHERYTGETKGHVLRHVGCRHDEKMMPFQSMPICLAPVHVRLQRLGPTKFQRAQWPG